jgi:hypothetical protein
LHGTNLRVLPGLYKLFLNSVRKLLHDLDSMYRAQPRRLTMSTIPPIKSVEAVNVSDAPRRCGRPGRR